MKSRALTKTTRPRGATIGHSYWVEDLGTRLLIRGQSIPVTDFAALSQQWNLRKLTVMLPGIARVMPGVVVAIATKDEASKWEAEIRELAQQRADGDPELAWFFGPDAGTSSLTIFSVLSKHRDRLPADFRPDIPHDPDDFGRCHRLLETVPGWRAQLSEVAGKYPKWAPLVDAWDELTALWLQESPTGKCPKLYDRMQELQSRKG